MAFSNTSTNAVDCQTNQRIRATTTLTNARKPNMNEAQRTFEAFMRSNGKTDFKKTPKGRYVDAAMQTRWRYFQMGWELRGAK